MMKYLANKNNLHLLQQSVIGTVCTIHKVQIGHRPYVTDS